MTGSWPGRALRAAGAAAALAALTAGLPAVLYAAGGSPVPHAVPSWHQLLAVLARPEDAAVFLTAVRAVSWLAWAAFTACALAEAAALARGRRPARLPGISGLQGLAGVLVSTAVLAATTSPPAAAARPPGPVPARLVTGPAATLAATHHARPGAPGRASYRVREGDTLWSIAAARLGDGGRWPEIYALNCGWPQPGGQELDRPGLIEPGWTLRLPLPPAQPHHHHPTAPPPPPDAPAPPRHRAPGHGPGRDGRHGAQHRPAAGVSLPGGDLASAALAAAVAAAVVLAEIQRRRQYRPGRSSRPRPAAPSLPRAVTALRRAADAPPLPAAGRLPGSARPARYAGRAPEGRAARPPLILRSRPAAAPLYRRGPGGTRTPVSRPGGSARPGAAPAAPVPDAARLVQPPGVIAAGVRDGAEVHADLVALRGLGLTGPGAPAAARAILAGLLSRVLPGRAAARTEVIIAAADAALLLPGESLPGGPAAPGIAGLTVTATRDGALGAAEAVLVRRARLAADGDRGETAAAPPAAVLITSPERAMAGRLRAILQAGAGAGLAAVVLGDWPPGTTCHVAGDGTAACADPALDGTRLFALTPANAAAVISVLAQACGTPPPAPGHADPLRPAGPPSAAPPAPGRPAAATLPPPRPAAAHDPGRPQPAGRAQETRPRVLRVEVLGPVRILARGQEITGGLRKARELAAYLAVHPDGVTSEALTEALWPDSPHGPAQRALALRRLRDLLRHAAGVIEPMLVVLSAGRYRLDPSMVSTDFADFQAALAGVRTAGDDAARLAACRRAGGLYRGPLADGAGYEWAEPLAEDARRRALDAWARAAEILAPGRPDEALTALETALGHDPYNEWAYQAVMRLQARAGRPDAVRRTLHLLETRLADLGLAPGAQTRQLAATLLGTPARPPA